VFAAHIQLHLVDEELRMVTAVLIVLFLIVLGLLISVRRRRASSK